jgi:hypothetical protein
VSSLAVEQASSTLAPSRTAPERDAPIAIGPVDDPAEHEADRVAAELLRRPADSPILRRCACGGGDPLAHELGQVAQQRA